MKLLIRLMSLLLLFSMQSVNTKKGTAAEVMQRQPAKNISPAAASQPQPQVQQQAGRQRVVLQMPKNYAQALQIIKTLPANMVIFNNAFNPEFINLVKSFNFSDLETKALLEAGANIYTTWTNNEQTNKQTVSSLKNSIRSALPTTPMAPRKPTEPKPRFPAKPISPTKPAPTTPAQQPLPTQNYAITNSTSLFELRRTRNVVMALDPRKKETVATAAEAVFQQAVIALYYKSSAVIMTNNIFEMIVTIRQRIGEQNLQKLRTMDPQQLFNAGQQFAQGVKIPGVSSISVILLSKIIFDSNNFNCYFHTAENLVLLIPKEYIRANVPKALNGSLNDQARACGFNPQVLRSVTDLSNENLLKQLATEKTRPAMKNQFIPNLTAMFAVQKKNDQLIFPEQDSKWLIYIVGHGGPAHLNIGTAREQYKMIKQSIANARQNIAMGARIPANMKKQSEDYLREYEPRLKEYEEMLEGRSGWQNNQMVPESALITGVTAPEFVQLMTFFDESLDVAYVHYITCFAGGSNQTFVNETLSELNVKFIVSTQGAQESYTSTQIGISWDSRYGIKITGQDFAEFFRLLRMFFTNQEEFVKTNGKTQEPIRMIIKTISSDDKPQNQPFVRFPGAGSFEAMPTTRQTKTITKTMVKAHEIEKKPFDFSDPRINVVIINSPRINVPVDFGKKGSQGHIAIVTPSPATFTPGYEGLLLLKEVNWQDTLQSLLFNLSYLNNSMFPQTFVITTLRGILLQQSGISGKQGAAIKNFIMHMSSVPGKGFASGGPALQLNPVTADTIKNGQVGANIHAAFELDDTIYYCFFAIRDIEKTDELLNGIERLKFTATPKKSMNMNTFVQNFVAQQEIAQVAKPITLESIATFVDDKIDRQDPSMAIWSEADQDALLKTVQKKAKK